MAVPAEHANKAAFLDRVKVALGRDYAITHAPDYPPLKATLPRQEEKVRTIQAKVEVRRARLLTLLADKAAEASWNVHSVNTSEGAVATVAEVASRSRRRSELRRIAFEADLGITGVTYAIAETASCVITPGKGVARMTSLAPPAIVLLVEAEQVLESLDDFFAFTRLAYHQTRGRTPTYYNFISGPSRTADIEQTLTIGVHGPGEVHMVLIG